MSMNGAKALVAKLKSDEKLAAEFKKSKSEEEFLKLAKKHGYDTTLKEFQDALKEYKEEHTEISDAELDQVAGGISIVGVDYVIVGAETSQS